MKLTITSESAIRATDGGLKIVFVGDLSFQRYEAGNTWWLFDETRTNPYYGVEWRRQGNELVMTSHSANFPTTSSKTGTPTPTENASSKKAAPVASTTKAKSSTHLKGPSETASNVRNVSPGNTIVRRNPYPNGHDFEKNNPSFSVPNMDNDGFTPTRDFARAMFTDEGFRDLREEWKSAMDDIPPSKFVASKGRRPAVLRQKVHFDHVPYEIVQAKSNHPEEFYKTLAHYIMPLPHIDPHKVATILARIPPKQVPTESRLYRKVNKTLQQLLVDMSKAEWDANKFTPRPSHFVQPHVMEALRIYGRHQAGFGLLPATTSKKIMKTGTAYQYQPPGTIQIPGFWQIIEGRIAKARSEGLWPLSSDDGEVDEGDDDEDNNDEGAKKLDANGNIIVEETQDTTDSDLSTIHDSPQQPVLSIPSNEEAIRAQFRDMKTDLIEAVAERVQEEHKDIANTIDAKIGEYVYRDVSAEAITEAIMKGVNTQLENQFANVSNALTAHFEAIRNVLHEQDAKFAKVAQSLEGFATQSNQTNMKLGGHVADKAAVREDPMPIDDPEHLANPSPESPSITNPPPDMAFVTMSNMDHPDANPEQTVPPAQMRFVVTDQQPERRRMKRRWGA